METWQMAILIAAIYGAVALRENQRWLMMMMTLLWMVAAVSLASYDIYRIKTMEVMPTLKQPPANVRAI